MEKTIHDFFVENPDNVVAVYLYGSTSRGDARPDSDVDVGVLLEVDPPATFAGLGLRLEGRLEKALGKSVDLVIMNRAPVDLIHRIFRDGKLVLDLQPSSRIAFEVLARNRFFDLEPVLKQVRRTG